MNFAANFSVEVAADCCFLFLIAFVQFIELADLWVWQFSATLDVSLSALLLLLLAAAPPPPPLYRVSLSVCWDIPCSGVLLEKLTVSNLVKTFSTLYRAPKFSGIFTKAHQLSQSRDTLIRSTPFHLRLGPASGIFSSDFSADSLYAFIFSPTRATYPTYHIIHHPDDTWWPAQTIHLLIMRPHLAFCHFPPCVVTVSCQASYSRHIFSQHSFRIPWRPSGYCKLFQFWCIIHHPALCVQSVSN